MTHHNDKTDLPVLFLYNVDAAWSTREIEDAFIETNELEQALRQVGHPLTPAPIFSADLVTSLGRYDPAEHIVFNWCEGLPGIPKSDALVAQTLEAMRFAYTGSTSRVLRLSQDKGYIKTILEAQRIPTPRWRVYTAPQLNGWRHFPAIVKPSQEHCSVGVTPEAVVQTPGELYQRVEHVVGTFDQPALVEEFIDGPEFHITLWGNEPAEVLPPVAIDFSKCTDIKDKICSYDFKYEVESTHFKQIDLDEARLGDEERGQLERTSLAAYRALGCRDYARLDVRLRDGVFYVLDVNPNAGISFGGSVSYAADMAGYSYGQMGSHLVNLAARRHSRFGPKLQLPRPERPRPAHTPLAASAPSIPPRLPVL